MLGLDPSFTAQLAAERSSRFVAEAASARWRRLLRQPHPAPPCAGIAAQLPPVVVALDVPSGDEMEPAA